MSEILYVLVVTQNSIVIRLSSPAARNHVNRMCLAADIPLIESGTAGYLGQVTVIKKVKRGCSEVSMSTYNEYKALLRFLPVTNINLIRRLLYTNVFSFFSPAGGDRVLRVSAQTHAENFPRLHHPQHSLRTHPLHRLGQIPLQVRLLLATLHIDELRRSVDSVYSWNCQSFKCQ